MANEEAKELAERQDGMEEVVKKKPRKKYFTKEVDFSELNDRKMVRCAKILERMVNQNNYNEITIGAMKKNCIYFKISLQITSSMKTPQMNKRQKELCSRFGILPSIKSSPRWKSPRLPGILNIEISLL